MYYFIQDYSTAAILVFNASFRRYCYVKKFKWKDPDAGKDWGQEEKGTTEDEMVGWHHRLNGHEFGWTLGVGDGQGGLACCGSWGCKESDMTEWLNWTELKWNLLKLVLNNQLHSVLENRLVFDHICTKPHVNTNTYLNICII